jgi:vitamin B12/bleomycin/antimicrobial peptide transport system ATP-binding/permease protein
MSKDANGKKSAKADDKKAKKPKAEQNKEPKKPELEEPDYEAEEAEDDARRALRRHLVSRFWKSAKGFWSRDGKRIAWILTIVLVTVMLLEVVAQYWINQWNRLFFDALEKRDTSAALFQGLMFPVLAAISVGLAMTSVYVRMTMQRLWREWLNNHVVDYWMANGRYYQLNLVGGDHANPEFRIADDLRIATDAPIDFLAGIASAALSAATFIVVLWTIGGSYTFTLGGTEIYIPGFLVIAAALYALFASVSMVFIGRRFVTISEYRNQSEAEYRYALTRVRENGESISLLGGEQEERAGLDRGLKKVLHWWRELRGQHMRTTVVSQSSAVIAPVIPILLCAPKFLDGSMTLGQVMQAASAFVIVQSAFSWLVNNYPRFADWRASAQRVASLLVSLDRLNHAEEAGIGRIDHKETKDAALRLNGLSVTLDDGTSVIDETEVAIQPGEKVLVVGESGTGKSSLVRAVAGLWPWGEGEVQVGKGARIFLLPQKPYVPLGTLRRATTYPAPVEDIPDETVAEALEAVGLGQFVERIDDEDTPWEQTLSGGEKQRLAFARILIHKPEIIVLDEATSALDPPSQEKMMQLLDERLKEVTVISVGHRPELEKVHERKLVLAPRAEGARLVRDEQLAPVKPRRLSWKRWQRMRRRRRRRPQGGQGQEAA